MRVEFAPEAQAEFEDSERYYTAQVPGLGERFRTEIKNALRRVRNWPLACPIECSDIRRCVLSRFPYKLLYAVEPDRIYIVAVAHMHRKPEYWVER